MSEAALGILDEFLQAPDAAVRRKGVSALAALESEYAGARLVAAALEDGDPGVRASAEKSIAALSATQRATVDQVLQAHLDRSEHERETYALLGRLRLQGYHSSVALGSWGARLRRAFGLFPEIRQGCGWRFWFRGCWPALQGALFGWFILFGLVLLQIEFLDDFGMVAFGALLVVMAVTVRTTPTWRHFDRAAGVVVDVLFAMALALMLASLIVLLSEAAELRKPSDWMIAMIMALAAVMLIAVTRGMAALTAGAVMIPFVGAFISVCAAAFAAIFTVGALLWAGNRFLGVDLDERWATCWPIAFALARLFFKCDWAPATSVGNGHRRRPARILLASAWAVTLTVLVLVILAPGLAERAIERDEQPIKLSLGDDSVIRLISRVPIGYALEIQGMGLITVEARREPDDDSLQIQIRKQTDKPSKVAPVPAVDQVRLDFILPGGEVSKLSARTISEGQYTLHVTPSVGRMSLLRQFSYRLSLWFRHTVSLSTPLELSIRLDEPPPAPRSR